MEFDIYDMILACSFTLVLAAGFVVFFTDIGTTIYNVNNDNYIQASHNDIKYGFVGDDLLIRNATLSGTYGVSMRPTIFAGNKLIEIEYTNQQLREGQIIIFKTVDGFTAHRIKGIYGDYVTTQGDNNQAHEYVNYENITHIVIGVLYK